MESRLIRVIKGPDRPFCASAAMPTHHTANLGNLSGLCLTARF